MWFESQIGPFHVLSDVELPMARSVERGFVPRQVTIERGAVPQSLQNAQEWGSMQVEAGGMRMLLRLGSGTRILLEQGCRIRYDGPANLCLSEMRLFLLGMVWAGLCYQNGFVPLHASAVALPGDDEGVIAVCGDSGAGKSTLAAALSLHGCALFADDMLTLDYESGGPLCFPGHKQLKLWEDVSTMLKLPVAGQVWPGTDLAKHYVPLGAVLPARRRHLRAVFILSDTDNASGALEIVQLAGARALANLTACVYQPPLAKLMLRYRQCFEVLSRQFHAVPIYTLSRPRDLPRIHHVAEAVVRHCHNLAITFEAEGKEIG